MDAAVESDDSTETPDADALYRHRKRDQWGVAVFLWERDSKRAFRFADGEVRVFKEGFYQLMVPAPTPEDGSADELRAKVLASANGGKEQIIPLVRDQLMLVLETYEDGFIGETWREKHRGGGRRLKRHRDPAIKEARELLDGKRIAELYEHGDYTGVLDSLVKVLSGSDLVPSSHVAKLKKTNPSKEFARAFVDITKDPAEATLRQVQTAFVAAGGPATSWQVLSAPLALLVPHKHLCVRPSVFGFQGKIVHARFNPPKRANEAGYQRYLEVVRLVEEKLTELGHAPPDLLDVHDFVWMTLRPGAREELDRIHIQHRVKEAKPTLGGTV